jgi:DNA-binding transcriptional LysR family regulator
VAFDWEDLHYAIEVARAGTVIAAARALGVAQSTVYRRLTAFEERAGAKLFDRRGGAYVLTRAGEELLRVGVDLDDRVARLERDLAEREGEAEGEVTVATMDLLAVELTRVLPEFRRAFPKVTVRLVVSAKTVDLDKHEADVALRVTREPAPSLVGRKIADVAFAAYATSQLAARARAGKTIDWVTFDETHAPGPIRKWEKENVPADHVALRTTSRPAFVQAVEAGLGAGVLPCGYAARSPSLVAISPRLDALTMPLWMLAHAEVAKAPRVRAVLDRLSAALSRERAALEGEGLQ